MRRLTQLLHLTPLLLLTVQLCHAACVPEDAPPQPNQDALARLLEAQDRCPRTALEFRNLIEGSGARLETTMVNFLGFHNPNPGAFFLFEIVSGQLSGLNLPVERGDLLFGHFLTKRGSRLVINTTNQLLVEVIAWDPTKQLFNFYELLIVGGPQRIVMVLSRGFETHPRRHRVPLPAAKHWPESLSRTAAMLRMPRKRRTAPEGTRLATQ